MSTYIIVKKHIEKLRKRKLSFILHQVPGTSAFSIEDDKFKKLFILSKQNVRNLCKTLYKVLAPKCETRAIIPIEIKVLCALHYFATGSHQRDIARDTMLNISQSTVSRCVMSISDVICNKISPKTITFPKPSDYRTIKGTFNDQVAFPGTIGVFSNCHFPIVAPHHNSAFMNRDGYHSLNVLLVCDGNMKITFIDASYPGSSMDWFVWRHSKLRVAMEMRWYQGDRDSWLLASGKYQPEPWLLTPFKDPVSPAQRAYNRHHRRTLGVVHRCIDLLKKRFGCLSKMLKVGTESSEQVVRACATLHNLCLDEYESVVDVGFRPVPNVKSNDFVPVDELMNASGLAIRDEVTDVYFT